MGIDLSDAHTNVMLPTGKVEAVADEKLKQVTYRIPGGLVEAVDYQAQARGITSSQFIREALEEAVSSKRRTFQYPGFTPEFDAFLAERNPKSAPKKEMLILVEDVRGQRSFHDGKLHDTGGSLISLSNSVGGVTIPRHYIQGWYPADDIHKVIERAMMLIHDGWRPNRIYFQGQPPPPR